jgi:hypothetical protein
VIKNTVKIFSRCIEFFLIFCILSTMNNTSTINTEKEHVLKLSISNFAHFFHKIFIEISSNMNVQASPTQDNDIFLPLVVKPYTDMSYYLRNTINIYGLGVERGQQYEAKQSSQNGVVIFDYGSPYSYNGNYGTTLFDYTTVIDIPQIKASIMAFSDGFWFGLGFDYDSFLTIIIGTNSSGYYVTKEHGEAWGIMINELNDWLISKGYNNQIRIVGGNDMETNFRDPSEAIAWVDGYSTTGFFPVYNFGNASGCPLNYPPTEPEYQYGIIPLQCDVEGWTQEDVYHVSWGSFRAYPFPEIYNTTGANAQQWYRIALYKNLVHIGIMEFNGSLAQFTACEQLRDPVTGQLPIDCIGTNNTAEEAHKQLQDWLNSDPYGRVEENLVWSTDIMWYEGVP